VCEDGGRVTIVTAALAPSLDMFIAIWVSGRRVKRGSRIETRALSLVQRVSKSWWFYAMVAGCLVFIVAHAIKFQVSRSG
jgi:hypothetical protein